MDFPSYSLLHFALFIQLGYCLVSGISQLIYMRDFLTQQSAIPFAISILSLGAFVICEEVAGFTWWFSIWLLFFYQFRSGRPFIFILTPVLGCCWFFSATLILKIMVSIVLFIPWVMAWKIYQLQKFHLQLLRQLFLFTFFGVLMLFFPKFYGIPMLMVYFFTQVYNFIWVRHLFTLNAKPSMG